MIIQVRRAEASDAKALKEIYECPNTYTETLQLPYPSVEIWENAYRIFLKIPMSMLR